MPCRAGAGLDQGPLAGVGEQGLPWIREHPAHRHRVLFGKYSGNEVEVDGEECLIVKEEDLFGILSS